MLTEGNRNSDLGGEWSIEWTGGALKTNGFEGSKFLEFAQNVSDSVRKKAIWGCGGGFGALGLRGWAGAGQCCEFRPDWPISIWGQINTVFIGD